MGSDFFWDHVPAPVSDNIGKIFAGVLLLLMISPVIIVLVDAVITKERPSFLARVLKESKWTEYLGALVFANFFLFAVLAMFSKAGRIPGEKLSAATITSAAILANSKCRPTGSG